MEKKDCKEKGHRNCCLRWRGWLFALLLCGAAVCLFTVVYAKCNAGCDNDAVKGDSYAGRQCSPLTTNIICDSTCCPGTDCESDMSHPKGE